MSKIPIETGDESPHPDVPEPDIDNADEFERAEVKAERDQLREFVKTLSLDDIQSGNWFEKLLIGALATYTKKVDWSYFQEKYKGVPADAIVQQRIKLAARYASIEGGLSAGVYSAAVVATIGSAGGASPVTIPGAAVSFVVDAAYLAQLQLRLAYDISVLYRVPLNTDDPEDLWKLIRVSFAIKAGSIVSDGALKVLPAASRYVVKRYFSGAVLTAAKGLPFVGKFLLQRTVIKIVIPGVSVPVAAALNYWTTTVVGKHARAVFRSEARVIEIANGLVKRSKHPQLMLWVAWLVIMADGKISDSEALLIQQLVKNVRERHGFIEVELVELIDVMKGEVWTRIASEPGDLTDLLEMADVVAEVDGTQNSKESELIHELKFRCLRS